MIKRVWVISMRANRFSFTKVKPPVWTGGLRCAVCWGKIKEDACYKAQIKSKAAAVSGVVEHYIHIDHVHEATSKPKLETEEDRQMWAEVLE